MKCPDCGQPYACPCKACTARNAGGDLPVWITISGDKEACPNCGIIRNLHDWNDIAMDQYDAKKNIKLRSNRRREIP